MATPIRYDNIFFHGQYGHKASADFKKYLIEHSIAARDLEFEGERIAPCLEALSTWFEDGNGGKIQFTEMPVLTYDEIYWESDDKSVVASTRKYAVKSSDLPNDFLTKAVKIS